jgi:hypothetical protein
MEADQSFPVRNSWLSEGERLNGLISCTSRDEMRMCDGSAIPGHLGHTGFNCYELCNGRNARERMEKSTQDTSLSLQGLRRDGKHA